MAATYYTSTMDIKNDGDMETELAQLNKIRESIENMSKFNQIEVLRILTGNKDVIINENKYCIHINLSELRPQII